MSEIRHWRPEGLEALRDQVQHALQTLTREGDEFARLKLTAADWNGEAASRSMQAHDHLVKDGDHHAAGLARSSRVSSGLSTRSLSSIG